jgi:hypothetical protein
MGDQPVARPLPAHRTTQTRNKRKQTSMPRVGSEHTIPVFEKAKTVYALNHAATVIGSGEYTGIKINVNVMYCVRIWVSVHLMCILFAYLVVWFLICFKL